MRITNFNNLPEPLVKAVSHQRKRIPGVISVTELITPPQLRALSIKHDNEIQEDASERLWALMGTMLANALEKHAEDLDGHKAEEQLETEILGWKVTGRYDLSTLKLDGELLTDYKLTSVWALKDGIKREWEEQLNCYRYLIEKSIHRYVMALEIVGVYRDWSKTKARLDPDYPQTQVQSFAVPLWSPEQTLDFLEERVRLHQEAEKGIYPECTESERWARPTQWALMKKGQKKAVKLFLNKDMAIRAAGEAKDLSVVERPGVSVRCEGYCPVNRWCAQYRASKPTLEKQLAASLEIVKPKAA